MTLKGKIEEVKIKAGMEDELEKIADDYAIEFAEWLFHVGRIGNTKEVLEMFKKEKGL